MLQKADTLLESLYRPWKVGRLLWMQELRCRKLYTQKNAIVYHKLERKGYISMAFAHPIMAKSQDLQSWETKKYW